MRLLVAAMFEGKEAWIGAVVVAIGAVVLLLRKLGSKYPPGPYGLPGLGYIPFLREDVHVQFIELARKYGEVFSLSLGSENVVVLNGAASVKEAYSKAEFLGRPPHSAFSILGSQSPFFLDDLKMWQEQRKFVVHSMKDLGLGSTKIEQNIQDEIGHFLDVLGRHEGRPVDLLKPLTPSVSNNVCALVFGRRFDYDDEDRILLDKGLDGVSRVIAQTASHIFFPWIRHLPFVLKWLGYDKGMLAYKTLDDFFMLEVEKHKKTLDPKNIRDFIDSFLVVSESRKAKDPNTSFTNEVLLGNITDVFGAGTEPVRTSFSWCVCTMAAHPGVQERVLEEILQVVGADRRPEVADRRRMPYTRAVLQEVMRWKTTLPLNLLRYTTADAEVGGYCIPKGTTIMANFWAVHHDPKCWTRPEDFEPERFLNEGAKSPNFMPFSVGKRACPGEMMATIEIFLYFVSILQKFEIRMPEGVAPLFEAEVTITYRPKPYKVRFIPRD